MSEALKNQQIDLSRFAKGVYFLEILTHKFKDGNGRVARSLKLLFDKCAENGEITEDDTKKVLGVGREIISKTGTNTFKINFNPDFERLVLGMANFGLHKGLSEEQVTEELALNGTMPEKGLEVLSQKLGIPKGELKREFIHFMAVDSDLDWCEFGE